MKREIIVNKAVSIKIDSGEIYCCKCQYLNNNCRIFGNLEFDIFRFKRHLNCINNEVIIDKKPIYLPKY